jgi:OmpA-OmpF porin, OOP family
MGVRVGKSAEQALGRVAAGVFCAASVASPASAFELSAANAPPYAFALGTATLADSDRDASDDIGFGGQIGFGVPVLTWLTVEASYFGTRFNSDAPTDFSQRAWGVDWVVNFGGRDVLTPFVLVGGGRVKNDVFPDALDESGPFFNLGAGFAGGLAVPWLRYRGEARLLHDNYLNDRQDFRVGFGVEVVLGDLPERPAPPSIIETVKVIEVPAPPPSDQDGDGVVDQFDRCPDTLKGVTVDGFGCVVKAQTVELRDVTFEFNSSELTPNGRSVLEPAVRFLLSQPALRAEVAGHTDSIGSEAYNLKLSRARAESVREYLISRGVAPSVLSSVGYGEAQPVASNDTDEGRALNRRVELKLLGER